MGRKRRRRREGGKGGVVVCRGTGDGRYKYCKKTKNLQGFAVGFKIFESNSAVVLL